jgi:hypothetical protein
LHWCPGVAAKDQPRYSNTNSSCLMKNLFSGGYNDWSILTLKKTKNDCHETDHVGEKQIKLNARAQGHGELIEPGNYGAFEIADKFNPYYLVTWTSYPYTSQQAITSGNTFIPAGEQIVDADYWTLSNCTSATNWYYPTPEEHRATTVRLCHVLHPNLRLEAISDSNQFYPPPGYIQYQQEKEAGELLTGRKKKRKTRYGHTKSRAQISEDSIREIESVLKDGRRLLSSDIETILEEISDREKLHLVESVLSVESESAGDVDSDDSDRTPDDDDDHDSDDDDDDQDA